MRLGSMRPRALLFLALLLTAPLAGCIDGEPGRELGPTSGEPTAPTNAAQPGPDAAAVPSCEHPWPCQDGTEWPPGLTGPFDRLAPEHVQVESHDGTLLDGWVWRPDLPEGVGAPVLLEGTPYLGTCSYQSVMRIGLSCRGSGGMETRLEGSKGFDELIEAGYAVAIFSVRGTGGSGGCYDLWGEDEQRDQVAVVQWLAGQPWSNGRVGMTGLSYAGTTPWEAAIHQAPALKAITVGGIISDPYLGPASPQGAIADGYDRFRVGTVAANSYQPAWSGGDDTLLPWAGVAHERFCPESLEVLTRTHQDEASDERTAGFWEERRLVDRFGDVQAAVLVIHGFQDDNFHRYQEDAIWGVLDQAPKAFVLGPWGHTMSLEDELDAYPHGGSWVELTQAWHDFWLKGIGDPPAQLGTVDYQLPSGRWMQDTAWPPTAAREEALYLSDGALVPAPTSDTAALDLTPIEDASASCADDLPLAPVAGPPQLYFDTGPTEQAVTLAGNPRAILTVTADKPRGLFAASLWDASPDWDCAGGGELAHLTSARVDLRFHQGNMEGQDFPVDQATQVRVDFYNLAHELREGHRLILSLRNPDDLVGQHDATTLVIHGASYLVAPIIEGTLGGGLAPEGEPARPFLPTSSS